MVLRIPVRNRRRRDRVSYTLNLTAFDGSTQYMLKTGSMGGSDSPACTAFAVLKMNGGNGATQRVLSGANTGSNVTYVLQRHSDNRPRLFTRTAGFTTVLDIYGATTLVAASGQVALLFSGDGATAGAAACYRDGVLDTAASPTQANLNGDFNTINNAAGSNPTGGLELFNGCMGQVMMWPALNLALADGSIPAADLANFFGDNGDPVNPALAVAAYGDPTIKLTDPAATFNVNSGSGGDYTITGGPLSPCT